MITSSIANPNPTFYDQLKSWYEANLLPALSKDYGLTASVVGVVQPLPFTDANTSLNYVETLYLIINGWTYPLFYGSYVTFESNLGAWEALIVDQYNRETGSNVKPVLTSVPSVSSPAPPPSNPVGALIEDGTNTKYMNLSGISGKVPYPIGFVYTDPKGQQFILKGYITPWGPQVWWEKLAG